MVKNTALKFRMIFAGVAAVLIPFTIAGIIIYIQLSSSLLEMSKDRSIHLANDISSKIDTILRQKILLASSIAADPVVVKASKTGDYNEVQVELEAIHKRIGTPTSTIFLLDRNGIARADPRFRRQIGLNLSDREYFLKAKQGKSSISGPLHARGTATPRNLIMLVSAPIIENNDFYGAVVLGFDIEFIIKILSETQYGDTGYAYLLDSEGLVLVHPRKEFILKVRVPDQPGSEKLNSVIQSRQTGVATYTFEGVERIAGLDMVGLTGWIAVFSQSQKEIMAPVNKVLLAIFISGMLFLIATIIIIIITSSRISRPIHKFMEMLDYLTRHSNELIIQIGLDKKIIGVNPAFEKLTGIIPEKIIGTELEINSLNNVPDGDIWDSLEAGAPWSGRVSIKGDNSMAISLGVMIIPIRSERGAIEGYLEIGRDITAELVHEMRLQQAQKLEAIGTMAGGIAHDFNNILGSIFGYAELTLLKKGSVSDMERNIRQIIAASERARDLVKQILVFSRKTEVELRPLALKSVIKEVLKLLRASIPAKIDIHSEMKTDSAIMAEPTLIHQVVMNLFTNAVHAIGENSGTIKLELEDFFVDEEFTKTHPNIKKGKHIVLRVSDTGSGMEPEIRNRIFDPFYTTKPEGEGTGLGLSVVHGIVNKLDGIITVYSEIGKGSVFNIFFPCLEAIDSEEYQIDSSIKTGTERIAVVDDETAIVLTMQNILNSFGYHATAFADSRDALTALATNPNDFDMLITDYSMPHFTGLEIARKLRETGINIPIILASGFFGPKIEEEARKAGVSELITKPINAYKLTEVIRKVLDRKKI